MAESNEQPAAVKPKPVSKRQAQAALKIIQSAAVGAIVGEDDVAPLPETGAQPEVRSASDSEIAEMSSVDPTLWRLDRVLMDYPWFSVANAPEMKSRKHRFGEYSLTITPSSVGMATQADMDVLRYAISELNRRVEANVKDETLPKPPRTLVFIPHRFFTATNRDTSKKGYDRLLTTLRRLRGTTIETNLSSNGQRLIGGFSWIDSYALLGEDDGSGGLKRLKGVSITLSQWVYDAVVEDRRVLSFSPEYFKLRSPLDRRLTDIARKCCGKQPSFTISLEWLYERSGSTAQLKKFKALLEQRISEDQIIDYTYEISAEPMGRGRLGRTSVVIRPRAKALPSTSTEASKQVIEGVATEVANAGSPKPRRTFPDTGSIRYGPFAGLARDHLPKPTPDVDKVANRFRAFCEQRKIPLDAKNIEATWISFCKSTNPAT